MTRTLNPGDRRALLLGAACILGLTVAARGIPLWWALRADRRAEAAETMARAEELASILGTFDEAMDSLESRTAQLSALGPALVAGEAPAVAGSNVEALLAELARASLVRLDAVDIKVDTAGTRQLPLVTLEVQATADITGLSALLEALERGPALLAVRRLSVRSSSVEAAAAPTESLSVRLTVEGLGLVRVPGHTP